MDAQPSELKAIVTSLNNQNNKEYELLDLSSGNLPLLKDTPLSSNSSRPLLLVSRACI